MRRILAVLLTWCTATAQQMVSSRGAAHPDDTTELVVHINVSLVQVDAAVTDSKGRPVAGLKPEDFEVFQDGVPQKIANFSYITEGKPARAETIAAPTTGGMRAPLPPIPLKPEQVRRAIALVVDDLGLSFESVAHVRHALKKFVDEDIQAGDLVAIIRTGGGIGALQQFTNDKRLLYAAIDHVKLNFNTRARSFALRTPPPTPPSQGDPFGSESSVAYACQETIGSNTGSVGAIRYVVQGLSQLPGRKALVLFSESMQMQLSLAQVQNDDDPRCDYSQVLEAMRRLADAAERASVVIYAVDPRGIETGQPGSEFKLSDPYNTGEIDPRHLNVSSSVEEQNRVDQHITDSLDNIRATQQGLEFLADETGGTFVFHNDTAGTIRDAVDDAGNYYLLGYHPPANTFEGKDGALKFHRVTVRVKQRGLIVRSRKGFFGFPGGQNTPTAPTPQAQFARALSSPFAQNDIHLRMTALFTYPDRPTITTLLYVDGKDLTFMVQPDGTRSVSVEAVELTFDANGQIVDNSSRVFTLRGNEQQCEQAAKNGIILTVQHPVQKPGPYQVRIAVRDSKSEKIGSASQFVEVPDVKHGHLALTGILLGEKGFDAAGVAANTSQTAVDRDGNPAIRSFKPGENLTWGIEILNGRRRPDPQPNITVETRLFRGSNEIYEGKPIPVIWPINPQTAQLAAIGGVRLGDKLAPGDYALQLVVNDSAAKQKYATASQWIDFRVDSP